MDLKFFLLGLAPKYYGDLTVDSTAGGVGFDPNKLEWQGVPAKLVRYTLEDGDIRSTEVGVPTVVSGDLQEAGAEVFVPGTEAVKNWRAIRTGVVNGKVRYHVYF